jgi:hypothetical protein
VSRHGSSDAGVAPWLQRTIGVALPLRAHAQAADVPLHAVDDDGLPMIAGEPAQGTRDSRRIEGPHLDSGAAQRRPKRVGAAGAQPVVDDVDPDAGARAGGQRRRKGPADVVVVDDVALEEHEALGTLDRREPGRVVLCGVEQQADRVAVDR